MHLCLRSYDVAEVIEPTKIIKAAKKLNCFVGVLQR